MATFDRSSAWLRAGLILAGHSALCASTGTNTACRACLDGRPTSMADAYSRLTHKERLVMARHATTAKGAGRAA